MLGCLPGAPKKEKGSGGEGSEGVEANGFCTAAIDTSECCPENPPFSSPWETVITRSSAQNTAAKMAEEFSLVGRRPRGSSNQFAVLQIAQSQFQHFTDTHTTTGHQFKNQSITNLGGSEDDFIDGFLLDDFPSQRYPFPIQLPNHGPVAWVPEFGIDVVAHEIEKGRDLGKTDSLGIGFVAFGETVQVG